MHPHPHRHAAAFAAAALLLTANFTSAMPNPTNAAGKPILCIFDTTDDLANTDWTAALQPLTKTFQISFSAPMNSSANAPTEDHILWAARSGDSPSVPPAGRFVLLPSEPDDLRDMCAATAGIISFIETNFKSTNSSRAPSSFDNHEI